MSRAASGPVPVIFGCVCAMGSLAMLIVSFTYAIISRSDFKLAKTSIGDLIQDWKQDMVFEITSSGSPNLADTNHYLADWKGRWPGTKNGCFCSKSSTKYKVTIGLKERECNRNETIVGCNEILSTPDRNLEKWINGQTIRAVRVKGTSFLEIYKNINSNGKCKSSDQMHCGNPNSTSKGFCIPGSLGKCPITNIATISSPNYAAVPFAGFTLYTSTDSQNNPISHLQISESHMCFVKSQFATSPGRTAYELKLGEFSACREDKTAFSVGEMGEKTFFDINGLGYNQLTAYSVSDDYKYKLLASRTLDWSPDCADTVPTMQAKNQELEAISIDFRNMVIVYSISFAFTVITMIGSFIIMVGAHKEIQRFKIIFICRTLFFIMTVPVLVLVYVKVREFYKFFDRIHQLECSTGETNANFVDLTTSVKGKAGYKTEVALGVCIAGYIVDILLCIYFLCYLADHPKEANTEQPAMMTHQPIPPSVPIRFNDPAKAYEDSKLMGSPENKPVTGLTPDQLPPGFLEQTHPPLPPGFMDGKTN